MPNIVLDYNGGGGLNIQLPPRVSSRLSVKRPLEEAAAPVQSALPAAGDPNPSLKLARVSKAGARSTPTLAAAGLVLQAPGGLNIVLGPHVPEPHSGAAIKKAKLALHRTSQANS